MLRRTLQYKSFEDLSRDTLLLASRVPADVDIIAGVPRSGLLAANLLALFLNKPLADIDGLLEGRILSGGQRTSSTFSDAEPTLGRPPKVLVIDDSVAKGLAMKAVREKIKGSNVCGTFSYGAVYVCPGSAHHVDYFARVVPRPRLFEWNLLHHAYLNRCCLEIDGVLCRNPTAEESYDESRYRQFIEHATPNIPISFPVGCLITTRPERYRPQTEAWLARHGINYQRLVMAGGAEAEGRMQDGACSAWKAAVYREEKYLLFIESDRQAAEEIAHLTGKSVYCIGTGEMVYPTTQATFLGNIRWLVSKSRQGLSNPGWALRKGLGAADSILRRTSRANL